LTTRQGGPGFSSLSPSGINLGALARIASLTTPRPSDDYLAGPGVPGLVSVIIPTYNRAGIVGAAIESVLEQSHADVEVIVVDDGSTDETRGIVESYGPRVRYLAQANAGVSAARNVGLMNARGEFIALLDSDDRFLPWKLEAQIRVFRQYPAIGMVWTDMSAVTASGAVVHERYLRTMYSAHSQARLEERMTACGSMGELWQSAPRALVSAPLYVGDIFSPMLLGNLVHTSTVVIRRSRLRLVGGFDTSLAKSGEDYEFHLRTCSHGSVGFIDASSLRYRIGAPDQLTASHYAVHIARNNLTTLLRWLERGRERIELPAPLVRRRLAHALRWVGEAELENGNRVEARKFLWKSLRHEPLHRRSALLFAATTLPAPVLTLARTARRVTREARSSLRPTH
jgi:GT2 family glycosyltransferase